MIVMTKKWTTEMFIEHVEKHTDDFEVKGKYINNMTKISMHHKICGRDFEVIPANFKMRYTCPLCSHNKKKSKEEFEAVVFNRVGNEYLVLGDYINCKTKILMKHNKCGNEYLVTPDDFSNGGNRCPNCSPNKPKDTETFKQEVDTISDSEYELIGEYKGSKVKTEFIHNVCGHEFNQKPELFLIGARCPKCGLRKRSGENHYKYNFNLTDEDRLKRDMQNGEIRKWRNKVYQKDDYTCVKCNEVGGKLNAHHLNSWDKFVDERFNVKNGVTLCEDCHRSFHKKYGYGHNTIKQFEEYKASL